VTGHDVALSRRRLLVAGGATLALAACGTDEESSPSTPPSNPSTTTVLPALTAADFAGLGTCVLLPEQTAGPFPLDEQFDRRDITEGYPGRPTRLGFRVVDGGCAPGTPR
jgi:hypothetical protein